MDEGGERGGGDDHHPDRDNDRDTMIGTSSVILTAATMLSTEKTISIRTTWNKRRTSTPSRARPFGAPRRSGPTRS